MKSGNSAAQKELERSNLVREQSVRQGMIGIDKTFGQFGPKFFQGIRDTTRATLLPQVNKQYKDMGGRLYTTLADRGLTKSSAAMKAGTDLAYDKSMADIAVENQATGAVRDAQSEIQRQKQAATNTLIASQNPTLAAQQAVAAVSQISAPSMVAPIGNMFQNFANIYLANRMGQVGSPTVTGTANPHLVPSYNNNLPKNYYSNVA